MHSSSVVLYNDITCRVGIGKMYSFVPQDSVLLFYFPEQSSSSVAFWVCPLAFLFLCMLFSEPAFGCFPCLKMILMAIFWLFSNLKK